MDIVKREPAVLDGHFECPGCGIVMKLEEDRTMSCETLRCDRRGVRYRRPTMFLEVLGRIETYSESASNGEV